MIGKLTMNSDVGLLICLLTLLLAIFSLYWRLKYYIFHVKKQNIKDIYELRQKLPTLDNEPKFIQDMELGAIAIFQGLTLEQVEFLMQKNLSLQLMTNISLLMKHDLCRLEDNVLVIPNPSYINKKYLLSIKNIVALLCFAFFLLLFMEVIFSQNFTIVEYVCLLSLTLVMEFYLLLSLKGMIIYKHIIKMKQAVSDIELRAENNFDGEEEEEKEQISDVGKKKTSWFSQKLADLKQWEKEKEQEIEEPIKKLWKTEKPKVINTQSAKDTIIEDDEVLEFDEEPPQQESVLAEEDKQKIADIESYLLESYEIDRQVQEDLQKLKLEEYHMALQQAQPVAYDNEQPIAYDYDSELKYQNAIATQQPVAYEEEVVYQEEVQQEQPIAYETETEYQYKEEVQQEQPITYETETEYQYQEEVQQEQPVAYESETAYQYQEEIQQEQAVAYESETAYQYQDEIQQEQPVVYESEEPLVYEEHELKYQANVQQSQVEQTVDEKDNFNLPF